MYIIATDRAHVFLSPSIYTIRNAHTDICEHESIDKGLCSGFDVEFVTASGVYVQFGQKRKRNISNRTPSPVVHTLLTCLQRTLMTPGPGVDFELYYTRHCWLV